MGTLQHLLAGHGNVVVLEGVIEDEPDIDIKVHSELPHRRLYWISYRFTVRNVPVVVGHLRPSDTALVPVVLCNLCSERPSTPELALGMRIVVIGRLRTVEGGIEIFSETVFKTEHGDEGIRLAIVPQKKASLIPEETRRKVLAQMLMIARQQRDSLLVLQC